MTGKFPTTPEGHCGHECVCWMYIENKIPEKTIPCPRNSGGIWATCKSDTRKQPSAEQLITDAIVILEKSLTDIPYAQGIKIAISILRGERSYKLSDKLCDTCNNHKVKNGSRVCMSGIELNPYIWGCVNFWKPKERAP